MNGFIDHLQVVTTNNYRYFHNLQFTRAHSLVVLVCYQTFPDNGSNNGYSSAAGLKSSLPRLP
jgi:hypothetical protein